MTKDHIQRGEVGESDHEGRPPSAVKSSSEERVTNAVDPGASHVVAADAPMDAGCGSTDPSTRGSASASGSTSSTGGEEGAPESARCIEGNGLTAVAEHGQPSSIPPAADCAMNLLATDGDFRNSLGAIVNLIGYFDMDNNMWHTAPPEAVKVHIRELRSRVQQCSAGAPLYFETCETLENGILNDETCEVGKANFDNVKMCFLLTHHLQFNAERSAKRRAAYIDGFERSGHTWRLFSSLVNPPSAACMTNTLRMMSTLSSNCTNDDDSNFLANPERTSSAAALETTDAGVASDAKLCATVVDDNRQWVNVFMKHDGIRTLLAVLQAPTTTLEQKEFVGRIYLKLTSRASSSCKPLDQSGKLLEDWQPLALAENPVIREFVANEELLEDLTKLLCAPFSMLFFEDMIGVFLNLSCASHAIVQSIFLRTRAIDRILSSLGSHCSPRFRRLAMGLLSNLCFQNTQILDYVITYTDAIAERSIFDHLSTIIGDTSLSCARHDAVELVARLFQYYENYYCDPSDGTDGEEGGVSGSTWTAIFFHESHGLHGISLAESLFAFLATSHRLEPRMGTAVGIVTRSILNDPPILLRFNDVLPATWKDTLCSAVVACCKDPNYAECLSGLHALLSLVKVCRQSHQVAPVLVEKVEEACGVCIDTSRERFENCGHGAISESVLELADQIQAYLR